VSFKGQIKIGKFLKLAKDKYGYSQLTLYYKIKKSYKVHRLVAEAFVRNTDPEKFNQINHKDENKQNNHINNLEWCDTQYNVEYSYSKEYKILFPDDHKEIIFNLCKFCRENNLNQGGMNRTFTKGNKHKGFKILERVDTNGNIIKAKEKKRILYKIFFPDGHKDTVFNLTKFCKENFIDRAMSRTFIKGN